MQTFPQGLNNPKIRSFLSNLTCEEIRGEGPEVRDEIFNQILIKETSKQEEKQEESFLQKVKSFLLSFKKAKK